MALPEPGVYTNSFKAARLAADFSPSRGATSEMTVVKGNGNVATGPGAGHTFGGTVDTVLQSARIAPAPTTLEEARSAPGRRERIEEITRRIEAEGIKYVFFQQVSVTGRVMGKGVVSSFFPQVAEKGYQLVYGATANLFTDRYGDYIGFGPEESELAAVARSEERR